MLGDVNPILRVGVVGLGCMGALHLKKLAHLECCKLIGSYDPNPEKTPSNLGYSSVPSFPSLGELLFEVDAVTIASPTASHYGVARRALEAGVHVLVEKPITIDFAQAGELVSLAERKKRVLQVGFVERFRFLHLTHGINLSSVLFLEASRMATAPGREPDLDVVTDLMVHDIDIVLSLINEDPLSISARGISVLGGGCDIATARLEFSGGRIANLNASRIAYKRCRKMKIYTPTEYIAIDFQSDSVRVCTLGQAKSVLRGELSVSPTDSLETQFEEFFESIQYSRRPIVDGRAGLWALAVAKRTNEKILEQNFTSRHHPSSPSIESQHEM